MLIQIKVSRSKIISMEEAHNKPHIALPKWIITINKFSIEYSFKYYILI